jgi:hypothetical protein
MKKTYLLLLLTILVLSGCSTPITNFEECISAGNPAMESYPRKCRDPISQKTFTEEIDDAWKVDSIMLMRHEIDGRFGCFGCSAAGKTPALCIDPIMEMKPFIETSQRYCNSDFEIITQEEQSCNTNSECKLPMEYAIQSNCPFGTACIDSKCKVVCPLTYHDPNPEISKSYPFTCETDSDCDCTERGIKTLECRCIDNTCLSVE